MSTTETEQQTAVRYEKDARRHRHADPRRPDGQRQHHERALHRLDGRGRRPAVRRGRRPITGVVVTSAKKTFFAGGNLHEMVQATTADAPAVFELAERVKAGAAPARDLPQAGRRRDQRRRARRRLRDHAGLQPPDPGRRPKVEVGLPEASLGLLPGGGGVTRVVRLLGIQDGLMNVLLQGTRFRPPARQGEGARRRARRRPARSWSRPRRPGSRPTRTPFQNPWDAPGYKMPGGTPKTPALAAFLPAFPALLRKQLKGADYPAQKAILSAAVEGAQVDFDTALADRVALPDQPGRQPGLEEHDPGVLLRPAGDQLRLAPPPGHRAVEGHQGRRPRRRDDGRGHRLRLRHAPAWRSCSRTSRSRTPRRARPTPRSCSTRRSPAARAPRRRRPSCSAGSPRPPTRPTSTGCDLVIEAVFEDPALKHKVFAEIAEHVNPDALLCSNT